MASSFLSYLGSLSFPSLAEIRRSFTTESPFTSVHTAPIIRFEKGDNPNISDDDLERFDITTEKLKALRLALKPDPNRLVTGITAASSSFLAEERLFQWGGGGKRHYMMVTFEGKVPEEKVTYIARKDTTSYFYSNMFVGAFFMALPILTRRTEFSAFLMCNFAGMAYMSMAINGASTDTDEDKRALRGMVDDRILHDPVVLRQKKKD